METRSSLSVQRPRDGRHCDLCGCSQPAVRCDKCGCQLFCLSCDDMYHRHPKRRFHLRKAADPGPPTPGARPMLPMKVSHLTGDPSKMPLPPPRKKKPGKSFFDNFRRGSPSRENSPPLPKKEYSWTDRLGSIKKFMSNRPLPPLPNDESQINGQRNTENIHSMAFIHKRGEDLPPQLPQRSPRLPEMTTERRDQPTDIMEQVRNGSMNSMSHMAHGRGYNSGENNQWSNSGTDNQNVHPQQFGTLNRNNQHAFMHPGGPTAGHPNSMMHQSSSSTDLQVMDGMTGMPGVPHYPHYPMPPHFPYPMYPQQYPGYPGYFAGSFANLNSQMTTDGDFSDQSESSIRHHPSKKQPFRKRAKRSQSVMMDRMAYPGQYYPFGPFPPGFGPWGGGGGMPMEAPPSPANSMRSLNRAGRTPRRRKKGPTSEEDEFSASSSPLSRPKSSSSERRPDERRPNSRRNAPLASSDEGADSDDEDRRGSNVLAKRNSEPQIRTSPQTSPVKSPSPFKEEKSRKLNTEVPLKHSEPEVPSERRMSKESNTVPSTDWHCPFCTFLNSAGQRICQVCCKTYSEDYPASGSRRNSLKSPSPEKKSETEEEKKQDAIVRKNQEEMASLNSALDEAEKEISRGLEELMKLKDDFNVDSATNTKPQTNEKQNTSENAKPVYKSSGRMRSSILDKLNLPTGGKKDPHAKGTSSIAVGTESPAFPDRSPNRMQDYRRGSNSSSASDTYNSPVAQSPVELQRRDSSCQTKQDNLVDYLQRKRAEEEIFMDRAPANNKPFGYADRMASPGPYDRYLPVGPMQRSHSRASLFTGRVNDLSPMDYGMGYSPMYRSVSRGSLTGDFAESRLSEFTNLRKPDFYLSMEELVERRRQENMRAQGLELVRMIREAEQQGFTADDIQVALHNCGSQPPLDWLRENWRTTVDGVVSLATAYGRDKKENDVGQMSEQEARDALRAHKGNVWAAVTECVESRQRKFLELSARGKFSRQDIVDSLSSSQGDVELAYAKLTKSASKPFLMRIWGAGEGVPNQDGAIPDDPPSGLAELAGKENLSDDEDLWTAAGTMKRSEADRYARDEAPSEEDMWTEDEEDVDWEEGEYYHQEEPEDQEGAQKDLERFEQENVNILSQTSEYLRTPESDYVDMLGNEERSLSSDYEDDLMFTLPKSNEVKKGGTTFLSKLAALKKNKNDSVAPSSSRSEDQAVSVKDIPTNTLDQNSEANVGQTKSFGPLNILKNTISAIKDTVTGSGKGEKKLPCSIPERRTIIVRGQVALESLNRNDGVELKSIKPLDVFSNDDKHGLDASIDFIQKKEISKPAEDSKEDHSDSNKESIVRKEQNLEVKSFEAFKNDSSETMEESVKFDSSNDLSLQKNRKASETETPSKLSKFSGQSIKENVAVVTLLNASTVKTGLIEKENSLLKNIEENMLPGSSASNHSKDSDNNPTFNFTDKNTFNTNLLEQKANASTPTEEKSELSLNEANRKRVIHLKSKFFDSKLTKNNGKFENQSSTTDFVESSNVLNSSSVNHDSNKASPIISESRKNKEKGISHDERDSYGSHDSQRSESSEHCKNFQGNSKDKTQIFEHDISEILKEPMSNLGLINPDESVSDQKPTIYVENNDKNSKTACDSVLNDSASNYADKLEREGDSFKKRGDSTSNIHETNYASNSLQNISSSNQLSRSTTEQNKVDSVLLTKKNIPAQKVQNSALKEDILSVSIDSCTEENASYEKAANFPMVSARVESKTNSILSDKNNLQDLSLSDDSHNEQHFQNKTEAYNIEYNPEQTIRMSDQFKKDFKEKYSKNINSCSTHDHQDRADSLKVAVIPQTEIAKTSENFKETNELNVDHLPRNVEMDKNIKDIESSEASKSSNNETLSKNSEDKPSINRCDESSDALNSSREMDALNSSREMDALNSSREMDAMQTVSALSTAAAQEDGRNRKVLQSEKCFASPCETNLSVPATVNENQMLKPVASISIKKNSIKVKKNSVTKLKQNTKTAVQNHSNPPNSSTNLEGTSSISIDGSNNIESSSNEKQVTNEESQKMENNADISEKNSNKPETVSTKEMESEATSFNSKNADTKSQKNIETAFSENSYSHELSSNDASGTSDMNTEIKCAKSSSSNVVPKQELSYDEFKRAGTIESYELDSVNNGIEINSTETVASSLSSDSVKENAEEQIEISSPAAAEEAKNVFDNAMRSISPSFKSSDSVQNTKETANNKMENTELISNNITKTNESSPNGAANKTHIKDADHMSSVEDLANKYPDQSTTSQPRDEGTRSQSGAESTTITSHVENTSAKSDAKDRIISTVEGTASLSLIQDAFNSSQVEYIDENSQIEKISTKYHSENTADTKSKVNPPSKDLGAEENATSTDESRSNSTIPPVSDNNYLDELGPITDNETMEIISESQNDSSLNTDEAENQDEITTSALRRSNSITPSSPVDALRSRFEGLTDSTTTIGPIRPQSPFRRMSFNSRKVAIALERQRDASSEKTWYHQKPTIEPVKSTFQKRSIKQQLEIERRVRQLVADRKCRTYKKAEIVIQLMDLNFSEEEALEAARECSTLERAISYLQQECQLCAGYFPVQEIISMTHCAHMACRECVRAYFTVQIRDRTIIELLCPFCNEPDIGNEDIAMEYFNHLDIMLKKLVEPNIHELFHRKLRDRVLMRDPNFRWCSQCSSGFITEPNLKRLVCPDCNAVTCASCRRPWEREHQGISCEAFAAWKDATDPEAQTAGLARLLTEDGIDCPSCHFRYALAKGGCMHFRCIQCQHDFCSGCSRPFKMGKKCGVSEFCAKLGLHAHHPRNCLFYLRDKEPADLQRLLDMNEIQYNEDPPDGAEPNGTCPVMEQKETAEGMMDDQCGKEVQKGYAGLCRIHYVEYLGQLVNKNRMDPIQIFENDDLELVLRRANIRLPPKRYRESDEEYREKLIKIIKEELPLDRMDGS